jgi:hypothetical protein
MSGPLEASRGLEARTPMLAIIGQMPKSDNIENRQFFFASPVAPRRVPPKDSIRL